LLNERANFISYQVDAFDLLICYFFILK